MKGIGWVLLAIVAGGAVGIGFSQKPWHELGEQKAHTKEADHDMRKAEDERNGLLRQASRLESPAGREQLVRERGYRRPEESPAEEVK